MSRWSQAAKAVLQVAVLSAIWIAMEALREHFGWSMPAGLIGFALLAIGLFSGVIKASWLQAGTDWLMAEMLLFFIPALMSLLDYGTLLRNDGWRILLVIAASTLMVMLVTAFTVELAVRMRHSHET